MVYRVRFVHLGVDFEGKRRPICKPRKTDLTLTDNPEKVTCHICKERMERFFAVMQAIHDKAEEMRAAADGE